MSAQNASGTVDLATAATRLNRALTTLQRAKWRKAHGLVDATEPVGADGRYVRLTEDSVASSEFRFAIDLQSQRLRKLKCRPRS